jgi:hypothetical protein
VAGVGPVGLGAPLGAAQRAGVGRLGQVGAEPGTGDLLGDNRQPVVASKAKSACLPTNRASRARSSARPAGWIRPRRASPVSLSR